MQDGPFYLPDTRFGDIQIAPGGGMGQGPKLDPSRPPEYTPYIPAQGPGMGTLQTNPDLYENIRVANQSGFTNWWNTLTNSWNETQIGIGAADLMDGLKSKAAIQKELAQLDADHLTQGMDDVQYMQQKNALLDELSTAYRDISKARSSIYEDESDKNSISKAYKFKSDISNLQGSDARLIDQFKYNLPTALGSSLSLLPQGLMAAFGQKALQTIATRIAVGAGIGSAVPGAGTAVGSGIGLLVGVGSTLAVNLITRNLETKAEVGSQFLQDYEFLREQFLEGKPYGYELTDQEDNELVTQASEGAEKQYKKNMSLAISDSFQSLIFAGSFSKMLSRFADLNKFTRLATTAAGFYATKKLEGLEEGLQYLWSQEKSLSARGLETSEKFFDSLLNDYKDVTKSMQFFGMRGDGRLGKDQQFNASVDAGELLGGVFGITHAGVSIGKDVQGYYAAKKDLAALNPTKIDRPALQFKDELYAEFFGPKKAGFFGVLDQDADDRVFYFKEALKSMNKQRNTKGEPLLTKDELRKELDDIDLAYKNFKSVTSAVDAVLPPYGKEATLQTQLDKVKFRNQVFKNVMSIARLEPQVRENELKMNQGLAPMNDISRISNKLTIVNKRLKNSFDNYAKFLEQQKKQLEADLQSISETNKALGDKKEKVTPADQIETEAIEKYYDSAESLFDAKEKNNELSKVKSWPSLKKWSEDFRKTAGSTFVKEYEEARIEDNKEFADSLGVRPDSTKLNEEDKKKRAAENVDILQRAGYSKQYLDTLDDETKEGEANKALEDFKNRVLDMQEDAILSIIANAKDKKVLQDLLARPNARAAFNKLGYDINEDIEALRKRALQRLFDIREEQKNKKIRKGKPAGIQDNARDRVVVGKTKSEFDNREVQDYKDQFNVRTDTDGTEYASQVDVLNAIIASDYASEPEKQIAKKLLAVTKDEKIVFRENWRPAVKGTRIVLDRKGKPITGDYSGLVRKPGTTFTAEKGYSEVYIDLDYFGDEFEGNQSEKLGLAFESTVLHELIHRYTAEAVKVDTEAQAALEKILAKGKEAADAEGISYYGLDNINDLMTEGLTSPIFQKFLAGVEGEGGQNLWKQFIDALAAMLKNVFGIELGGTALEDVISITSRIIDGKAKPVNVIGITESLKAEVEQEIRKINPADKDAELQLTNTYTALLNKISKTMNDYDLPDASRKQVLDLLDKEVKQASAAIEATRNDAKTVTFLGKDFEKGDYVVIRGYDELYFIVGGNETLLQVRNKELGLTMNITDLEDIIYAGDEAGALEALDAESEEIVEDHGELYKSVVQEFEKEGETFRETTDPAEIRFQKFVTFLGQQNFSTQPYRGLIVQDDDTVAGFPIPRTDAVRQAIEKKGPGQIVVVVDKDGNPVKFDENFRPSPSGNYIIFNIETPKRILSKNVTNVAKRFGVTPEKARELMKTASAAVREAKAKASKGTPVFIDFTGINPGVSADYASQEATIKPISDDDIQRVVDLVKYYESLTAEQKDLKQQVKNFLFYFVEGANGYSMSGGQVKLNNIAVPVTAELIKANFSYRDSYVIAKEGKPYEVLKVAGGVVSVETTYPSYRDYLASIRNLARPITQTKYNGYIKYKIAEEKGAQPPAPDATPEVIPPLKTDENIFDGTKNTDDDNMFDISIGLEEKPEYGNELGLFDNKTTYELVKSLDRGLHNYLRKTALTTIIGALEDEAFFNKVMQRARVDLIKKLEQYKELKKSQLDSGLINQAYYDSKIAQADDKIKKLSKNFKDIVEYYRENSYVFNFSKAYTYEYDEDGNIKRTDDDRVMNVGREAGYDKAPNEVSPIDGASKETKALIRGLARWKKINDKFQLVGNSFNVPDLVNFAVTWNNLLKNLQGLRGLDEVLAKLEKLKTRFPEYGELLDILNGFTKKEKQPDGTEKEVFVEGYKQKADAGNFEARLMLAKFMQDLSKPEVPVIQNLMDMREGTIFKVQEATRKNVQDLKKLAQDNFQYKSEYADSTNQGNKVLSDRILTLPTNRKEEIVTFLRAIGLPLSDDTINDPNFNRVASPQIARLIMDEIRELKAKKTLIKNPVADLSYGRITKQGVGKRLNDILDLESKYSETAPTLSMINTEGNTEHAIQNPNFYTVIINAINDIEHYKTFQDLVAEPQFNYLDKPYARSSDILNKIFILDEKGKYGQRRIEKGKPVTISLTNISGTQVEDGDGKKTASMYIGDKLVSDFNQLIKAGFKEFVRAGDKNTSYGMNFGLPIGDMNLFAGAEGFGGKELSRIMTGYLKSEIVRMILGTQGHFSNIRKMDEPRTKRASKTSLFVSLMHPTYQEQLDTAVQALPALRPNSEEIYAEADKLAKEFMSKAGAEAVVKKFFYDEVVAKMRSLDKYGFSFNNKYWLDGAYVNIDPWTLTRFYIVNEFLLHVEQTKIFNGDVVFYSTKDGEAHKRFPAFGAIGLTPNTDEWFINSMNKDPNTNLQAKLLGVDNKYSNVIKTVVFQEHQPPSVYIDNWTKELRKRKVSEEEIKRILEPYKANKEADAQGWITMDYYRSFKISIGDWRLEQEKIYEKISKGIAINPEDLKVFPPIKAQYAGPVHSDIYHVPAFHKFSLLPLIPAAIKGTSLESLNERMIRNNVGYALMESGSKVGTIGAELESFYVDRKHKDNARKMKPATDPFQHENLIFTHFLKEQVQIEPEIHEEVIFGTQFRKLLFQNTYDSGAAYNKKFAKLEAEYSKVIEEITNYQKDLLTEDMGIAPVFKDGVVVDYEVKDEKKLIEKIRKEVKKRKLNNSIKDFFEVEDNKLKYSLDASINHQQIRTLIMSMINNRLIRQSVKGDLAVQVSGLGFEKLQKPTDAQLEEYGSNGLRFYHVEGDKIRAMQVKTSLIGDFVNLLKLSYEGKPIGNIETLNRALKDQTWVENNRKSITMIGYRIPTQGLNSIEVMEVAEFLPPETGGILIVPTEIVAKTGSDFDIDKLSIFKPSLREDGTYINRTEYKGTKKKIRGDIKEKLRELIDLKNSVKLPEAERLRFIGELEKRIPTASPALAEIGVNIANLREEIQEAEDFMAVIQKELKANFDTDAYEQLVALRGENYDRKVVLAELLDQQQALKQVNLGSSPENMDRDERILEELYDSIFKDQKKANREVQDRIDALKNERTALLDEIAEYKFGLYNRIIEIGTERLTDPDSFVELITPNDTGLIKPKVNEIAQKQGTDKKPYINTNILTSSTQEEKFLAGIPNKKALGIAAVANTMSQLFNKTGIKLNAFFNKRPVFHPMIGPLNFSARYLKNGVLKSEIESQMINAYVDVLNDDFISRANLSEATAGAFFYLLHLGHDHEQLLDFFNHPVVVKYVNELQKNKSIIKNYHDYKNGIAENQWRAENQVAQIEDLDAYISEVQRQEAIRNTTGVKDFADSLEFKKAAAKIARENAKYFTRQHLSEAVSKQISDLSVEEIKAILGYYMNVIDESRELLKLQQVNNYDTSTSVNPLAHEIREVLKGELLEKDLFNKIDVTNPTVIKPFNQFSLVSKILDILMPVTLNKEVRTQIVQIILDLKNKNPDVDKITRTFINDWIQFIAFNLGEIKGQKFGLYGKDLLSGPNKLVDKIIELRFSDEFKNLRTDYPIIQNLRAEVEGNMGNVSLYREDNSVDYQNSIIEQFQNLAEFDDPGYSDEVKAKIRGIFQDLMVLGFTQSGLNKSKISFSDLIPNEYYAPMMNEAINKYKALDKNQQNRLFYDFIAKFRTINTQIMGTKTAAIPYWRFKDYNVAPPTAGTTEPAGTGPTIIISGGQIGGDLGGLEGARELGIETGGTAPPGFISGGKGSKELLEGFGLTEGEPDPSTYPKRTMKNVDDSDGTVAVLWGPSAGTSKTIGYATTKQWKAGTESNDKGYRPVLVITTKDPAEAGRQLREFTRRNNIKILNVAGHRETSQPGIQEFTRKMIVEAFRSAQPAVGINISTKSSDPLGRALTNPTWGSKRDGKNYFDVETEYKASKSKNPDAAQALKDDMNIMYILINKKLRDNPELIDEINKRGGLPFIQASTHIVHRGGYIAGGAKNSRWEGKGMDSNFIKVLAASYTTVAKELGKFVGPETVGSTVLYEQLGNKTESGNVRVVPDPWEVLRSYQVGDALVAMRNSKSPEAHWGNPFGHMKDSKFDIIHTKTIKEAVQAFIDWLTTNKYPNVEPTRRQWILDQIASGVWRDKAILYYKELGEPSHATALDRLINGNPPQAGTQLSMFDIDISQQVDNLDYVFNTNPRLAEIGSKAQYADYTRNIFPASKNRQIVFRGNAVDSITTAHPDSGGIWFADSPEAVVKFGLTRQRAMEPVPAVLNMINPKAFDDFWHDYQEAEDVYRINRSMRRLAGLDPGEAARTELKNELINQGYDSAYVGEDTWNDAEFDEMVTGEQFIVFNPWQIHVLGSEIDIEGFKQYVGDTIPLELENGTYEALLKNLQEDNIITRTCR